MDSIKWVRSDSIVVGCFQLTEDGKEENYLVQVIRSREGKISDVCRSLCFDLILLMLLHFINNLSEIV